MQTIIRLITICATAIFLLGCSGGGGGGNSDSGSETQDKTPLQKFQALEASGKYPKLDRTDTLSGIDANDNGVRDDIEAYIAKTYPKEEQRKAAMQDAKTVQLAILAGGDKHKAKQVSLLESKSIHCLFVRWKEDPSFNPDAVSDEILSLTTNTRARLNAYLAYNHALDGTSSRLPNYDTCE